MLENLTEWHSCSISLEALHSHIPDQVHCYVLDFWQFHILTLFLLSHQQIWTAACMKCIHHFSPTPIFLVQVIIIFSTTRVILFIQKLDHAIPLFNKSSIFLSHEIETEVFALVKCPSVIFNLCLLLPPFLWPHLPILNSVLLTEPWAWSCLSPLICTYNICLHIPGRLTPCFPNIWEGLFPNTMELERKPLTTCIKITPCH